MSGLSLYYHFESIRVVALLLRGAIRTICRSIGEYVAVPPALVTTGLPLSLIA